MARHQAHCGKASRPHSILVVPRATRSPMVPLVAHCDEDDTLHGICFEGECHLPSACQPMSDAGRMLVTALAGSKNKNSWLRQLDGFGMDVRDNRHPARTQERRSGACTRLPHSLHGHHASCHAALPLRPRPPNTDISPSTDSVY